MTDYKFNNMINSEFNYLFKQLESQIIDLENIYLNIKDNNKMENITAVPKKKEFIDWDYVMCRDVNGHEIDHTEYDKMMINGNSLDLFGINHDDVVFIKKQSPAQLSSNIKTLPKTLVFKRTPDDTNKSEYMIARAWAVVNKANTPNISYVIRDIANKRDFTCIKNDIRYVDYNYLSSVLNKKKLPDNIYQVIMITRLDEHNHWVLDFVPASDFYGIAEYTFHKNDFAK